jgi:starvation-inducible DNA-binding protein
LQQNPFEKEEEIMKAAAAHAEELERRQEAPLATPTDLTAKATKEVAGAMNAVLADVFALYLKTKNFHWHLSGPHFRDYHLLLDEHGDQIFAMTDAIAERVRKVGGTTVRSIGHIARLQRLADNDAEYVEAEDMLAELREDNKTLAARLREAHNVCDENRDIATASLIETWIDETERRTWFLFEASRRPDSSGH